MSVSGADASRVNRVLTTTLDWYAKKISNELARNDGIIGAFGAKSRIKVVDGGERAIETVDYAENSNFGFRSKYADIPTNLQDSRLQAKYAYATISGTVVLNDVEKAMNAGDSKIYDLVGAELENANSTIKRQVADALRAASPGASNPESLYTIIQDTAVASQTGTTGELNRATYSWWRNQYSNTSMALNATAGYQSLLGFILDNCAKGSGKDDQPDIALTTGTLFAALSAGAEGRKFYTDPEMAKLGFNSIVVNMNTAVMVDPSITSGNVYLINSKYMRLQVLRTPGMKDIGEAPQSLPVSVKPFQDAFNSLSSAAVMYLTFALTASSLQRQGIATNCS